MKKANLKKAVALAVILAKVVADLTEAHAGTNAKAKRANQIAKQVGRVVESLR